MYSFNTSNITFVKNCVSSDSEGLNETKIMLLRLKCHSRKTLTSNLVCLKWKDWKAKMFQVLAALIQKGINRIAKIGYGDLCLI